MKKIILLTAICACATAHTNAHAAVCTQLSYEATGSKVISVTALPTTELCNGNQKFTYYSADNGSFYAIQGCSSCPSGYTQTWMEASVPYCDAPIHYYGCQASSSNVTCGGVVCNGSTWWETNGAWATKKTQQCRNNACVDVSLETECAIGYYDDSLGNCLRCPALNGVYGTTPGYGSNEFDCYIPKDTTFSDSTGSGTFTNDCQWD